MTMTALSSPLLCAKTIAVVVALICFLSSPLISLAFFGVNAFLPIITTTRSSAVTTTTTSSFGLHHKTLSHRIGGVLNLDGVFQNRRFMGSENTRGDIWNRRASTMDENDVGLKPEGWEVMTAEEHLKYQREVFDEKSVFFGSEDAVDEELVPVLTHLGKRVVEQMVQSRLDGEGKVDDGEDEGITMERKKYKILDVGCGTGALFPYYLKAADNAGIDLSITGLDLSPKMISLAKKWGETLLTSLGEGGGSKYNFNFVEGDFVRTVLGEEYETKNEGEGEENGSGDKKRTDNLIGCGDGVEDELTEEHRGAYDAVVINACFGNFYDQVATTTAACQSLKLNGIFAISHPLGADFVRKLNIEDSSMVPHHLPTALDLRRLTRTQPLSAHSVLDEEINLLDATRQVQSYPFYYASTSRVPHRPLRDVVRFRAPVARGYGRGGKKLGFPTANLESSPVIRAALEEVPTGVYFGWAVLEDFSKDVQRTGRNTWHRAVVNVGLSPTFEGKENGEKIVEAHLILNSEKDIEGDFYDETMRLALSGFLRPEKKFPSFPDLINAINGDVANAREALGTQLFVVLKTDGFLADLCLGSLVDSSAVWVGASGGDENASYEFQNLEEAIADTPMGPLAV